MWSGIGELFGQFLSKSPEIRVWTVKNKRAVIQQRASKTVLTLSYSFLFFKQPIYFLTVSEPPLNPSFMSVCVYTPCKQLHAVKKNAVMLFLPSCLNQTHQANKTDN